MKNIIKNDLKILGLDEKEGLITKSLKDFGVMRPVDLAIKTGVKRTTVNFLLKKLSARGLVNKIKVKGHYEWQMCEESKIKKLIDGLYGYFNPNETEGTIQIPPDIGIEIFKGKNNVMPAYEKILEDSYNHRFFSIQGNKSVYAINKLNKSYIKFIQNKFRKYKIILDGVIGESSLLYIKNLGLDELKIYQNRLVVCYISPDAIIDFDLDIIIFKKMIIMANFEKNLMLIIKNENIYNAIFNMLEAIKLVSRKIDLNAYIKNLIKEKTLNKIN